MKKGIFNLMLMMTIFSTIVKAQYVTVADANFATVLQSLGVSGLITNGNQLDTTIAKSVTYISCEYQGITDISTLQYFTNLTYLDCSYNSISTLFITNMYGGYLGSYIPASVVYLDCSYNSINYFGPFEYLENLQYLNCSSNLPPLYYSSGQPIGVPDNLVSLICSNNQINELTNGYNSLPYSLVHLDISNCTFTNFDASYLDNSLQYFNCSGNAITSLGTPLPSALDTLYCAQTEIDSLPALPANLLILDCYSCGKLTTLPALPAHLASLECEYCNIFRIPSLPANMSYLNVSNNANLNWVYPTAIQDFEFASTNITCFPTYGQVQTSNPLITTYPLCGNTYITIPDTNFVKWLNNNGYSSCMNGNQMDTLCAEDIKYPNWQTDDTLTISNQNIADLTGVGYLSKAIMAPYNFDFSYNKLKGIPPDLYKNFAPNGFDYLFLSHNNIDSFYLDRTYYGSFYVLDLSYNQMVSFQVNTGEEYWINEILLNNNLLTTYPDLLGAGYNNSDSYPVDWSYYLNIRHNLLTTQPPGPFGYLDCGANLLTSFQMGAGDYNALVYTIVCDSNNIRTVSIDPNAACYSFNCSYNHISSINSLGGAMSTLNCSHNDLTALPPLRANMSNVICNNNPITCLPVLTTITNLNFDSTDVTCIPNLGHVSTSTPLLSSLPICTASTSCALVQKSDTVSESICNGQSYDGHTTAGTYIDTFVLASGYDSVRTLNLTVLAAPSTTITHGYDTICENQSVTLTASAGSSYTWYNYSGGVVGNTQSITIYYNNLPLSVAPGYTTEPYSVTITDSSTGCSVQAQINVIGTEVGFNPYSRDVSCFGGSNGELGFYNNNGPDQNGATAFGGSGGYNFYINGQNVTFGGPSGFPAGTYSLWVIDALGCQSQTTTVTLTQPDLLVASISTSPGNAICQGLTDSLTASASGGTPGYTYHWNNGATTALLTTTLGGNYTVTVTDSNSCTAYDTTVVTLLQAAPTAPILSSNSPVSLGDTIKLSASSTNATTYHWSGPNGFTSNLQNPSIANATTVMSGTYSVTASNTCSFATGSINVTVLNCSPVTPSVTATILPLSGAACIGTPLTFTAVPVNGGTSPSYQWYVNGVLKDTGSTYTSSAFKNGDSVKVVMTSGDACAIPATATSISYGLFIYYPGTPSVALSVSPGGTVCPTVNLVYTPNATLGGTAPTYQWLVNGVSVATGDTFRSASLNNGDVVKVIMTSNQSCITVDTAVATATASILAAPAPVATSNSPVLVGDTIKLSASTVSGAASYHWTGPDNFSTVGQDVDIPNASVAEAGEYSVYAADLSTNGCNTRAGNVEVVISGNSALSATLSQTNILCNGGSTGSITVTASYGSLPYSYQLNEGTFQASNVFKNLPAGNYTVLVKDAGDSTVILHDTLIQPSPIVPSIHVSPGNSICQGLTDSLTASATGGTPGYTYHWNGGAATALLTTTSAGNYTVTITDAHSCTATDAAAITLQSAPSAPNVAGNSPVTAGDSIKLTASATNATAYHWSGPDGFTSNLQNPSIANSTTVMSGTYSVTASNSCGSSTGSTNVTVVVPGNVFTLYMDTVSGVTGQQVTILVRVKDFKEILSTQSTIQFDPTKITYAGVQQFGISTLTGASFGTTKVSSGQLVFSWSDPNLAGVTLADGTVFFSITFNIIGATGQSSMINFVDTPVIPEFVDTSYATLAYNLLPGEVIIAANAVISGRLHSALGAGVRSATVSQSGLTLSSVVTDTTGDYSLTTLAGSADTITPGKNNDNVVANGVTTLDLLMVQRYILGTYTFSSPYELIAADVNSSGTITTLDILLIRSLILGNISTFPGNKLWAFVPTSYVFPNPQNPFPFPQNRIYPVAANTTGQDFIGMKLGDVNNSWNPGEAKTGAASDTVEFYMPTVYSKPDSLIWIPVIAKNFNYIAGMQFTVQWDTTKLGYIDLDTTRGALQVYAGASRVDSGLLAVQWNAPNGLYSSVPDDTPMFYLQFLVKGEPGDSIPIYINSAYTPVEVDDSSLDTTNTLTRPGTVVVQKVTGIASVQSGLWDVQLNPNPFNEQFHIQVTTSGPDDIQVKVFDMTGRLQDQKIVAADDHNIIIGGILSAGMYMVEVKQGANVKVIKAIKIE